MDEADEWWFVRVSRLGAFRRGALALLAGLFLSGYLATWTTITGDETRDGLTAPLFKHMAWAEADRRIARAEVALAIMGVGLVFADLAWRRWAERKGCAGFVALAGYAALISCCGFGQVLAPFLVWML